MSVSDDANKLFAALGTQLDAAGPAAGFSPSPPPELPDAGPSAAGWTPDLGPPRPIDQIAVKRSAGYVFISADDWRSLMVADQKELIKAGSVTFLSQGEPVGLKEAITYLRA